MLLSKAFFLHVEFLIDLLTENFAPVQHGAVVVQDKMFVYVGSHNGLSRRRTA